MRNASLSRAAILFLACMALNATAFGDNAAHPAAVATPDEFGSRAATQILQRGGNAVDAAVATAFVLAVTYPEAGNLGGGGFMTIYMHGKPLFLDYRETAPAAATRDMYLDAQGKVIADASTIGLRASGVPGTVDGLWSAHQRFGKLPWRDLLAPAIALARDGFTVPAHLATRTQEVRTGFSGKTNFDRYYAAVRPGVTFKQTQLAETLQRIATGGAKGFYTGRTAQLIAGQMRRGGGLITAKDLAGYKAVWREPLLAEWRDYRLVSAPLPSSGGFALIQLLGMKERLADRFAGLTHNSTQYVHLVAEMEKRVFADRAEYLGDPAFVDVPMARLISPSYIALRAAQVNPVAISPLQSVQPGLAESMHTTHFSILDGEGNAVANTYTLNDWFGNGVVVDGAGFLLNNEMDDFSIKPGVPNIYGVVGGTANQIEPGKRMLSSMSPTILLRDGKVAMVLGSPGGSTIFTSVFQTIVNITDFGMTPQQAVAASRFHHQLLPPDQITYSVCCALPAATIEGLRARGYKPVQSNWEFGDVQVIAVDSSGNVSVGSDPRGRGVGWVSTGDPVGGPDNEHEHHSHPVPEKLGSVNFPTTCAPAVAQPFNRALALLHSFAYAAAEQAFRAVAAQDTTCAIAHWGIAMSLYHQLWDAPAGAALQEGARQLQLATDLHPKSPREQAFIAALSVYFRDATTLTPLQRAGAYASAMAQVAQQYPDDSEAQIFYALALVATASPTDKTHANQKQAAAILEPLYRSQPQHPGLAHYLIHAYDSAELSSRGVDAARAYAQIAPSAPHALHMPSHIFTRLGYWDDSISSNLAARAAAREQGDRGEELHAMDYLTYAYLQRGRDLDANKVVADLAAMQDLAASDFKIGYAATAMPVRMAVERRRWDSAAALQPLPHAPPQVRALVYWARSLGHSRAAIPTEDDADIHQLQECLTELQSAKNTYWAAQVGAMLKEAQGWRLAAQGHADAARTNLSAAAELEESVEKLPVTPGPIVPAREQFAEWLLSVKQPEQALREFQQSLTLAPGRRGALQGAIAAAEQLGDSKTARALRDQLNR